MGVEDPVAEVDHLARAGRLVEAVDALAAAHRASGDADLAIRLLDLRHQAAQAVDPGPGRTPWPPRYDDPFPEVTGRLPEIGITELSTDVVGGAVAHHGALLIRGMFDDAQVGESVEVIRTAQRWRDEASPAGARWYRPFPTEKRQDEMLRRMVARQGGTWLADSPAGTAHFLDALASVGAVDVIAEHLGERPFFSLQKSTLRRSVPEERLTAWHQDGSFIDAGVRTMNVWAALSRCGGDYPSPGLELVPRRIPEVLPVEGILSPHAVSFDLVDEVASDTPVIRPEFRPGDALMFDELFLHRTYLRGSMVEDRYALECWFFAPSHRATGYVPFLV